MSSLETYLESLESLESLDAATVASLLKEALQDDFSEMGIHGTAFIPTKSTVVQDIVKRTGYPKSFEATLQISGIPLVTCSCCKRIIPAVPISGIPADLRYEDSFIKFVMKACDGCTSDKEDSLCQSHGTKWRKALYDAWGLGQ